MRKLRYFSAGEWLRLIPIQYALKQLRNDLWLACYTKVRPPSLASFLRDAERFRGRNLAVVIAFEQPWVLDWQLRMAQRNLRDTVVLVCDNSRKPAARPEIERVCRERGVPYLALPHNRTRHVNRSHGMAMTWIFRNVIRAIEPSLFAFLDHDLIPVQEVALAELLADQPCYGFTRFTPWSWNLWAGYCMYRFASVATLPLNFLYDFSQRLDTGGRNWTPLYRHHDHRLLRHAESVTLPAHDPVTLAPCQLQVVDGRWLHIGGIGYNDNFRGKKELCEHLAQSLDAGLPWHSLLGRGDAA